MVVPTMSILSCSVHIVKILILYYFLLWLKTLITQNYNVTSGLYVFTIVFEH